MASRVRLVVLACAALEAASSGCSRTSHGAADAGPDRAVMEAGNVTTANVTTDAGADTGAHACASCVRVCNDAGACDPIVFLSSKEYAGVIGDGGVVSADEECTALAAAAGLSGSYRAWIAAKGAPTPAARFTGKSSRPYRLRDGRRVAASFSALTKTLEAAISVTEKGEDVGFAYVWTGADPAGRPTKGATDCAGWSSADGSETGATGESDDVTAEWAIYQNRACSTRARLYCFEEQRR